MLFKYMFSQPSILTCEPTCIHGYLLSIYPEVTWALIRDRSLFIGGGMGEKLAIFFPVPPMKNWIFSGPPYSIREAFQCDPPWYY